MKTALFLILFVPAAQAADIAAYQCEVNGRVWIQTPACPKTVAVERDVDVTSRDPGATASMTVTVPVTATPLSRDDLCARLRSDPNVSLHSQSTPTSGYERNKMRSANGC